jgi:hypothetical protein
MLAHPGRVGRIGRPGGASIPFAINATAEHIRAAINDPTVYGESLGPELWSAFGTITAPWTSVGGGVFSIDGSQVASRDLSQASQYTISKAYRTTFTLSGVTGGTVTVFAGEGVVGPNYTNGTHTVSAAASQAYLIFRAPAGVAATVSAVSVREVVTGYLLPGLGGARLNASARSSVAMQQKADGTYEYAAHNLLLNSATVATQSVTVPSGARVTVSIKGTGSIAISDAATGTLAGTGASNRVSTTVTTTTTTLTLTLTGSATEGAVCLGESMVAYVPTVGSAVYAPAVDWLSAQSAYGLRSEAAATNLLTWSAKKSDAAWVKSAAGATVGVGVHACPISGSLEVLTLSDASASGIYQIVSGSNSTQYTTFVLFRPVAGQVVRFGLTNQNEGALFRIDYNCDTQLTSVNASVGFTGTSHSVVALGSTGWLVFTLTGTTPASGTTGIGQFLRLAVAGSLPVGHSQLETGSRASSPILTLGSSATRAADALVVPDSGWISSTQGTLAADYVPSAAGTQLIVELDDATANERHSLTNDGIFTVVDGGASQAAVDGGTPTVAARNKIAASYAVNAFAVALNGGAVVTDTSGTLPTVNRMDVNALNGHLTRIRYIGRRLSDGQLRALTE